MTVRQWVLALAAGEEAYRHAAVAGLVALGPAALPALMGELRDDASPVTETALLSVLCSIGASAFDPVLDVLQDAVPGSHWRALRVFTRLGTPPWRVTCGRCPTTIPSYAGQQSWASTAAARTRCP